MLRRLAVIVGIFGLMLAAAPVAAGGGGCHAPLTDAEGVEVLMSQFCFTPTIVRVEAGDTVTWTNKDSVDHNVVSAYMPDYGTPTLRSAGSAAVTFNDNGLFPYVCTFHPGMVGAVVVGDADAPPPQAVEALATPAITKLDAVFEQRIAALEAAGPSKSLLNERMGRLEQAVLFSQDSGPQQSWPPLAVGLLGGALLSMLFFQVRRNA